MLVSPKCGACSIVTEHHDLVNDAVCPVHAEHLLERSLRRRRQQSSWQIGRDRRHGGRASYQRRWSPLGACDTMGSTVWCMQHHSLT